MLQWLHQFVFAPCLHFKFRGHGISHLSKSSSNLAGMSLMMIPVDCQGQRSKFIVNKQYENKQI